MYRFVDMEKESIVSKCDYVLGTFWVHQLCNHINERQNRTKMIRFRNKKATKNMTCIKQEKEMGLSVAKIQYSRFLRLGETIKSCVYRGR